MCGGRDVRVLFRQRFEAVPGASLHAGYDVVVCVFCGCGYADGIPEQAAFDAYYRDLSKYEYHQRDGEESTFDRSRLEIIASIIRDRVPADGTRVLDVGCSNGSLLSALRTRGFADVTGLDPAPACAVAARRLYDLRVLTGTIADLPKVEERFDLIILVGVLEHVRELREALGLIRGVLNPAGRVYVEVPDALRFTDWTNAPFQDFSTEHINFFSPTSLRNLMAVNGFTELYSVQNAREQSFGTTMSNVSAIFQLVPAIALAIEPDGDSSAALQRYIDACEAMERGLRETMTALADTKRPILVWGVGTHTQRLLATTALAEANIIAFVDSNLKFHGKQLHGAPIIAPDALRGHPEPILIASHVFQQEIESQIRSALRLPNEIIRLYEVHAKR